MTELLPKVSIVITCYNYAQFVGQAIDSALRQTYANTEIVVIDDGSTDGSWAIISSYSDRLVAVRQENRGHIGAYNRGFKESTGDIVVFLDADDLLYPSMAEEVVGAWQPACVKIQYDLSTIDGNGEVLKRKTYSFHPEIGRDEIRQEFNRSGTYRWPVTTGNAFARRYLERVMPLTLPDSLADKIAIVGPDGLLNTIAPLYGEILTIAKPLACYRVHGQNFWAVSAESSTTLADQLRLETRIAARNAEIAVLRRHASNLGIALTGENILDHEMVFLNYRLMAIKLKAPYDGISTDSPSRLWWKAVKHLRAKRLPFRQSAMHFIWMSVLALAPAGSFANGLILLRFNRSAHLKSIFAWLGKGWHSESKGTAGSVDRCM